MNPIQNAIIEIQRQICEQTQRRTTAYYREDYGVLFVFEGTELTHRNVILAVSEQELALRGAFASFL